MSDLATIRLARRLEAAAGVRLRGLDRLAPAVRTRRLPAHGAAFREDDACPRVFVVRRGLFKQTYTSADGRECVKSFAAEDEAFACPIALAGGRTTFASVAIEASVVESIAWRDLEALGAADVAWQTALRTAFQMLAGIKVRRERDLLMLDAEALYRQFAAARPDLLRRVPQKDLAAHFGVTPAGFNRIVRRVRTTSAAR